MVTEMNFVNLIDLDRETAQIFSHLIRLEAERREIANQLHEIRGRMKPLERAIALSLFNSEETLVIVCDGCLYSLFISDEGEVTLQPISEARHLHPEPQSEVQRSLKEVIQQVEDSYLPGVSDNQLQTYFPK